MNAIFANTASGHNNKITRERLFSVRQLAENLFRHDAGSAAVDQRFAGKALVKYDRTVDRRDTALVASVPHAFNDAQVNARKGLSAAETRAEYDATYTHIFEDILPKVPSP